MKISDHCDGHRYFDPGRERVRGLGEVLRWKLAGGAAVWPKRVDVARQELPPKPISDGAVVTWIGHSTLLIQTRQGNSLTDPVYGERVGPVSWAGPSRVIAPGIEWDALPRIDTVLLSHDHFDHCDLRTLRRLAQNPETHFVAPLGHRSLLEGIGAAGRITELDWWDAIDLPSGAGVSFVPARHWCRRTLGGTNLRLWGGFMIRAGGRKIYFAGDTGYDATLFAAIRERLGSPDIALLPIGAYEPRWFMKGVHMNPEEAVQAHQQLGARKSIGIHWGTFHLTDEGREAPLEALQAAKKAAALADDAFVAVPPGASVSV
jgi:L-ascorbate metabolism protein UlaG (beta-lactamase superfamily)